MAKQTPANKSKAAPKSRKAEEPRGPGRAPKWDQGSAPNKRDYNSALKFFQKSEDRISVTGVSSDLMPKGWDDESIATLVKELGIDTDAARVGGIRRSLGRKGVITEAA